MNTRLTRGARGTISLLVMIGFVLVTAPRGVWAAEDAGTTPFALDLLSLQANDAHVADRDVHSVAHGTWLRLRGFGLWSQANSSIDFQGGPIADLLNDIDFEDTLGMDLDTFTGGALIGFNFGSEKQFHLDFTYWGFYDYDGDRVVGTIIFDDQVFTGEVESRARIHEGDLDLGWDFWRPESVPLTLTGSIGARVYHINAELQEVLTGREQSLTFFAPIPTLGLALRWDVTRNLYVRGAVAGIYAGELASYIDASAEIGFDITRNVGVFAGYRFWDLHVEWDDDDYDFDNGSVYAGVEVRL